MSSNQYSNLERFCEGHKEKTGLTLYKTMPPTLDILDFLLGVAYDLIDSKPKEAKKEEVSCAEADSANKEPKPRARRKAS